MRMRDMMRLVEGEAEDKRVRNEALKLWARTRDMLGAELLSRGELIGETGNTIDITEICPFRRGTPVSIVPFEQQVGGKTVILVVTINWNNGRPYANLVSPHGEKSATMNLFIDVTAATPRVTCTPDGIRDFLDNRFRSKFIHEAIHFFDNLRYGDHRFLIRHQTEMNDLARQQASQKETSVHYLSSPQESNAYYHQIVAQYLTGIRKGEIERPKTTTELLRSFTAMPWPSNGNFTVANGLALLTPTYRQKWFKRLGNLFQTRFA